MKDTHSMDAETKALMSLMARDAAETAVSKTLISLGIDHTDPIGAQRNMQALEELRKLVDDPDFQADLAHLRKWRKTLDNIEGKGITAAIGMMVFGGMSLILYTFRVKLFGV